MIDLGARCDRHTAEIFLPNCPTCLIHNAEWRTLGIRTTDERNTDD